MLIAIAGVILFLILASFFWVHRTDPTPKPPLHSSIAFAGPRA